MGRSLRRVAEPLAYGVTRVGCISIGIMALGMAYMLVGMQVELCRAVAVCH